MAPRQKKRKITNNNGSSQANHAPSLTTLSPATAEEKSAWAGFCEIESEPSFFNVMLQEFGVRGVKVQEVFDLDESLLVLLPQPCYGLIFLSRYRETSGDNQEASCPDYVWFANQTHDHACATVALLNIVNNIPEIETHSGVELGENLRGFRDFTADFPSSLRGDSIGDFEFVRQIHNSFAKKIDMLNIDLSLKNAYDDRRKKQTANGSATSKKKKAKRGVISDDDFDPTDPEEENAFHFVAYVPICGERVTEIWKLDGLSRQPEKMGKCDNSHLKNSSWLGVIRPAIADQMASCIGSDNEFNLIALVKDPLINLRSQLAANISDLRRALDRTRNLENEEPSNTHTNGLADGIKDLEFHAEYLTGPSEDYGIHSALLEEHIHGETSMVCREIEICDLHSTRAIKDRLVEEQGYLKAQIMDYQITAEDDARRARERRWDYTPLIQKWLDTLARKDGIMERLVNDAKQAD